MDEVMKPDEMMKVMQMATMNINQMSQQMGVIATQIGEINSRMSTMENRMQGYEDRQRVTRDQKRRIQSAVHERVNFLLGIRTEGGAVSRECLDTDKKYRSGFYRRCYLDARTHSRMGIPYDETYQRDFDDVIRYINGWEPEVSFEGLSGTNAYKKYLDVRREEKENEV